MSIANLLDNTSKPWANLKCNSYSGSFVGYTGSSVPAGCIGEIIRSDFTGAGINITSADNYFNVASITLTAGAWEISISSMYQYTGGAGGSPNFFTDIIYGISTDPVSGSFSDGIYGYTEINFATSQALVSTIPISLTITVNITNTTTYYYKTVSFWGNTNILGTFYAKRIG
jgi:hypothetical protein